MGIWPSFILRCLYHTEYLHSDLEKFFDEYTDNEELLNNPYKGL